MKKEGGKDMKILGLPEKEGFVSGHRACAGCGPAIVMRLVTKAFPPNTVVCQATGCMEVVSTPYPQTSWTIPWVHCAFENAAAVASGIKEANPNLNVVAIAGDGGTFDIGLQALSGMLERGHHVTFILYDNEAYMNTGFHRSGATPKFAETTTTPYGSKIHGKPEWKKPIALIAAAHGIPYVATASPHMFKDLYDKVRKAIDTKGPSFIHIIAPCTIGWRIESNMTIELCKLAVQTGVFPLYEIENGKLKMTLKLENRKPVIEYLKHQGRFKELTEEEVKSIQKHVDESYNFYESLESKGLLFEQM